MFKILISTYLKIIKRKFHLDNYRILNNLQNTIMSAYCSTLYLNRCIKITFLYIILLIKKILIFSYIILLQYDAK